MLTLRPRGLVGQRACKGQAVHVAAGKWTVPPGINGSSTWAGQRSVWRVQSSVKAVVGKWEPLWTGQAVHYTAHASGRSRTQRLLK